MTKFIIHKHEAKKAGLHYDLRFEIPGSKNWASFVFKKDPPSTKIGESRYVPRSNDHSKEEATFKGVIKTGYGAGRLSVWDSGNCIIHKYKNSHIVIEFKGRKMKGRFHLINVAVFGRKKDYKKKVFKFFKAKD